MTPEQKAKELVDKFIEPTMYWDEIERESLANIDAAKQCALIAVYSGGASRFFYVAKPSQFERSKGLKGRQAKFMDERREEGSAGGTNPRNRGAETKRENFHPTVKPIDLMRSLVKLVTPKHGICLDPFCGSGTTMIGCKLELINYIGIEKDAEHVTLSEARIKAWNPEKYLPQTLF